MSTSLVLDPQAAGRPADPAPMHRLRLDRDDLYRNLNARACWVHHDLCAHPLLTLPRLLQLAQALPRKYVRINSGAVPVGATPAQIPETGETVEQSFAEIEGSNTRIMLKKIELDPDYRDLLYGCIAEIEALGHPAMRGITTRVGYVFISAPSQTTPYHMDPEINFLLQIRGQKTFFVLPGDDLSILSAEDVEGFYTGAHDHLDFKEEWRERAVPFAMNPGAGVHIPVNHPHWVTTANEVTISLALTVETAATERRGMVCAFNRSLRRWGLRPTPPGRSPVRDLLKQQAVRATSGLKSLLALRRKPAPH